MYSYYLIKKPRAPNERLIQRLVSPVTVWWLFLSCNLMVRSGGPHQFMKLENCQFLAFHSLLAIELVQKKENLGGITFYENFTLDGRNIGVRILLYSVT